MKKLSDERIKEISNTLSGSKYDDEYIFKEIRKALQELLELRKTQPKFKIGQKVWTFWQIASKFEVWDDDGEIIRCCGKGEYVVYGKVEPEIPHFVKEDRIFATKPEAEKACRERNKEK